MKKLRELICWLFGHRSICLFRYLIEREAASAIDRRTTQITGWKCERCEYTFTEQWDQ